MDPNKIDLTSVNKEKKQFKLPKLKNPFKKNTAGPGRDAEGKFTSGSGGLINTKHFNWKRATPLIAVVALVGGFFVYRSFAGTYSACHGGNGNLGLNRQCVIDSDEAKVIRLYYGIFNRAPDVSGLKYWSNRLTTKKSNPVEIARQFMGSTEFKRKYGTLTNQKFVEAMYPQVFGRNPDSGGLKFWVDRLNAKKVTREGVMVQFTESNEMKNARVYDVAKVLNISEYNLINDVKKYNANEVVCYGMSKVDGTGKKICELDTMGDSTGRTPRESIIAAVPVPAGVESGEYVLCSTIKFAGIGTKPATSGYASLVSSYSEAGQYYTNFAYWTPNYGTPVVDSSFKKVCSTANVSQGTKSIAIATQYQYQERLDSRTARSTLQLDGITLVKRGSQISFAEDQNPAIYNVEDNTYTAFNVTINQKVVPATGRYGYQSYKVDKQSPQPIWMTTFRTVSGENEVRAHISKHNKSGNTRFKMSLKDVKTGQVYPAENVVQLECPFATGTCERRLIPGNVYDYSTENQNSDKSTRYFSGMTFKLPKSTNVSVEVEVIEGQISISEVIMNI